MIKKQLSLLLCLCLWAVASHADEDINVRLSDDNPQVMLSPGPCNIFVTKGNTDDNGNTPITVAIENTRENEAILVFHVAYNEDDLKKRFQPKTTFDKQFPGGKQAHVIERCENLGKDIIILPSDQATLPLNLQATNNDEPLNVTLPLYLAKFEMKKGKYKKVELQEKEVYALQIDVEMGPNKEFLALEERCDNLVKDIAKKSFCNNPKHNPSLEDQESDCTQQIKDLVNEIDQAIKSHDLKPSDNGYAKYAKLKEKLSNITFKERDCGKHDICKKKGCNRKAVENGFCSKHAGRPDSGPGPTPGPTPKKCCAHSSLSLSQVFQKLDNYYKRIHTGKSTKSQVIGDVNALYTHAKHCSEWKSGGGIKKKIEDAYKRINQAK